MTMTTEYGYGKLERIDVSLDEAEIRSACMQYIRAQSKNKALNWPPTNTEFYEKAMDNGEYQSVFEVRWDLVKMQQTSEDDQTE